MNALKALVIFLGVLIAFGMTFLIYSVIKRADDPNWSPFGGGLIPAEQARPLPTPPLAGSAPTTAFGDLDIPLGRGCVLDQMTAENDLLYLRIGPEGGSCERIILIDVRRGLRLGDIRLTR